MTTGPIHGRVDGPIVMIGFGSIGRGLLPLIERHLDFDRNRFVVIDPDDSHRKLLDERSIRFIHQPVTAENYIELLTPLLTSGDGQGLCISLAVEVSSPALMALSRKLGIHYIDTVVEPWPGFYFNPGLKPEQRSNYALREMVLEARRRDPAGITSISCCGANPGFVSWLVKEALLTVAADLGISDSEPRDRLGWAQLMHKVGVKGIHIAERDTFQRRNTPKPLNVFVNTWSIEGFLSEGMQPAELGWGTHERWMPPNAGVHQAGCGAAFI